MAVWRLKSKGSGTLLEQVLKSRKIGQQPVYGLPNLKEAVQFIKDNINDPIGIFGDYDVDGVCGSLVLKHCIEKAGGNTVVRLPTREDGYGIKPQHVEEFKKMGINTIITVDNGVTAFEAVEAAKQHGMNILITDHHEPRNILPDCIVVNPKIRRHGFRDYSGAGVAYMLGHALLKSLGKEVDDDLLGLVSLATVADIVPLVGPNFKIARKGLLQMRQNPSVGIRALIDVAGVSKLDGYAFGWQLGPRINAAGRMGDPMIAFNLLSTKDPAKAQRLAKELDTANKARQELVEKAVEECMKTYDGSLFPVFVGNYPHGIVGIIAGRIANTIRRPTIVGAVQDDGTVRASGRSVGEFSLLNALYEVNNKHPIFQKFGGHKMACGLEILQEDVPKLQEALNLIAADKLTVYDITEFLDIDGIISHVPSVEEVEELDKLEPFGEQNPEPVFAMSGPIDWIKTGDNWKLVSVRGVKFFADPDAVLTEGQTVHLALTPYVSEYGGQKEVMARVKDIKDKILTRDKLLGSFKEWREGQNIDKLEERVFEELGFSRTGKVAKRNLIVSGTFRKYGVI